MELAAADPLLVAGAARLHADDRTVRPFGEVLPGSLAALPAAARDSLLAAAAAAQSAGDLEAAAAAMYERIREHASGYLSPWSGLGLDARDWWTRRAAIARGRRLPTPTTAATTAAMTLF